MRLHSLTSSILILLYGVVGLTGESLHYLVQEGFSSGHVVVQDSLDVENAHGYHHCHGPDYHWHYHAPHSSQRKVADNQEPRKPTDNRESILSSEVALRSQADTHSPHACPLLALVASLRLGIGGLVIFEIDSLPRVNLEHLGEDCFAQDAPQYKYARGPPLDLFA